MMNRIILIGNGFDLAHGLKTSYADFIKNYWKNWAKKLTKSSKKIEEDELCHFQLGTTNDYMSASTIKEFIKLYSNDPLSANCLAEIPLINKYTYGEILHHKYISNLFKIINKEIETKRWVDIEYEYYQMLKQIIDNNKPYSTPVELDKEFEVIKTKLKKYLSNIQKEKIKSNLIKVCIQNSIYEPFNIDDISGSGQEQFKQFAEDRWKAKNVKMFSNDNKSEKTIEKIVKALDEIEIEEALDKFFTQIKNRERQVCEEYLLPSGILLLNFNYTKTADLYLKNEDYVNINHIHGELGNDKNPIIFGYGDELDEDYKKISNLNDNDYLKNIKSIRYLETDNYRKLLSFIDSAPFQIYIMGHSCGNSDRTLLNTLFEHRNCVSIKPFYYEKPDGTDNYIEIIQNISRNFNDMRLMRDRVVNKAYCRPLVLKKMKKSKK